MHSGRSTNNKDSYRTIILFTALLHMSSVSQDDALWSANSILMVTAIGMPIHIYVGKEISLLDFPGNQYDVKVRGTSSGVRLYPYRLGDLKHQLL